MKPSHKSLALVVFTLVLVFCAHSKPALAVDWSGCAADLDDIQNESESAADAARDADEAQEELDSKRSDLESCSDDCDDARSDYEDAKSDFEDKIADAKSELSTLQSNIQSASASCVYDLGSGGSTSPRYTKRPDPCSVYQRYKNRLPLATILKTCTSSMSESECKKCLELSK